MSFYYNEDMLGEDEFDRNEEQTLPENELLPLSDQPSASISSFTLDDDENKVATPNNGTSQTNNTPTMQKQQATFSRQLRELHNLIAVQKQLTGVDPLTNQPLSSALQQQGNPSQSSPKSSKLPSNVMAAVASFMQSNPNPTLSQIRDLARSLGISESQAVSYLESKHPTKATKDKKSPSKLEEKLGAVLDSAGAIASVDKVQKFIKLMSSETSYDGQKLMLTVLLGTKDPLKLNKFIELNGLQQLMQWLDSAKKENKTDFLKVLLKHLPMTISALRSSETGKAVKLLTKYQDADVASKANKLIEVWKQLLSEETQKDKKRPRSQHPKPVRYETRLTDQEATTTDPKKDKLQAEKKLVLSSTDDFDAMLSTKTETKKAKLLPDHIKPVEKRGKTLLDDTSTPVIKPQVKTYESKPLSNDAIKKAKLKEKALGKSEEDEPPTKKAKIPLSPKAGSSPPKGPVAEPEPEPEPVTAMETVKPENEPTEETDDVWRVPARAEEEFPMESSPGVSKKTGQAKKRVSWPAEGKLEQIRMFAKEEENFAAARQLELKKERAALLSQKMQVEEGQLKATVEWKQPPRLEVPAEFTVEKGTHSKQKEIQAEREQKELAALYFDEDKIPDCPTEPETTEEYDEDKVTIIPWDEVVDTSQTPVAPLPASTVPALPVNPQLPVNSQLPVNPQLFLNLPPAITSILTPDLLATLISNPQLLATILNNPGINPALLNVNMMGAPMGMQQIPSQPFNTPVFSAPMMQMPQQHLQQPQLQPQLQAQPQQHHQAMPQHHQTVPQQQHQPMQHHQQHQTMQQHHQTMQQHQQSQPQQQHPSMQQHHQSMPQQHQQSQPQHQQRPYNPPQGQRRPPQDNKSKGDKKPYEPPTHVKPCAYFNTPKGCKYGANCTFIHDPNLPQQLVPLKIEKKPRKDNRVQQNNSHEQEEETEFQRNAQYL